MVIFAGSNAKLVAARRNRVGYRVETFGDLSFHSSPALPTARS
jgi:hypothetical protein